MPGLARSALALALMLVPALIGAQTALAAAGGGSSSFGGGGGGSSDGFSGGGSEDSGSWIEIFELLAELPPVVIVVLVVIATVVVVAALIAAGISYARYLRRRRARREEVGRVALAAAQDDAWFHPQTVVQWGEWLFREAQAAWDARDRERLTAVVGEDLLVEWKRRLDDFDRKGWHNRVEVLGPVTVEYLGLVNRADDEDDRAVVRIEARLRDYVTDRDGGVVTQNGSSSKERSLDEWWTLGKRGERWILLSIEQEAEGRHHIESRLVATPADDLERLGDDALVRLAAQDRVADGFTVAEVADLDFDGDARAAALDLSLADARFAPDVLEVAVRRAVAGWAEAVDGDDAPLLAVASADAARRLLHPGGSGTRLVVRGPRVRAMRVAALDAGAQPPAMTVEVDVEGRRYVENRDTAALLSGSRDADARFTQRWTLTVDGPEDMPWRISGVVAGEAVG